MQQATPRSIWFLLFPHVHMLDLSGPLQSFSEANQLGAAYQLHYCSPLRSVVSAQGLVLAELEALPDLGAEDTLVIPGLSSTALQQAELYPVEWLRRTEAAGTRMVTVCSGSFVLAHAGLLDGRHCTTHWRATSLLRRLAPQAIVMENRLFVWDANLLTSAGISSGIDMALALIEADYGAEITGRVVREMVLYLRRDGQQSQRSIYLEHRNHLHPGVHRVQDWITRFPERNPTIEQLAEVACMSSRNLTRVFRQETGVTLKEFSNRLKLEVAGNLLRNRELTVDRIAQECGFEHPRQLRRLWKRAHGQPPSQSRAKIEGLK